ncbi:unnamed protein product [Lactuca virosa]|uniref:Ubiquitin-like protease family profile domain-containing protein n=1 Tax=Lactuca virosa TaxID=75947 RepID=A0AAU9NK36_9ASTR|nr:unnamed protein product [Lactuca virosa]
MKIQYPATDFGVQSITSMYSLPFFFSTTIIDEFYHCTVASNPSLVRQPTTPLHRVDHHIALTVLIIDDNNPRFVEQQLWIWGLFSSPCKDLVRKHTVYRPHKHRRFRNRCHRNPCAKGIYSYLYETSFILSNMHWVLLVICPSSRVLYILDSLMKRVQNPVDTYYLLKLLDMYEKNTSTPYVWMFAE